MTTIHNLGFPRIGAQRELKRAVEAYWAGEQTAGELAETGRRLRAAHWRLQAERGQMELQLQAAQSALATAQIDERRSRELFEAGLAARRDYELAQIGARGAPNWDSFLTGGAAPLPASGSARDRVAVALRDLGPGLGDILLRVCCYQEGLEIAEKRMGWAARSGKIVLRIALQRLRRHYDETYGRSGPLIG